MGRRLTVEVLEDRTVPSIVLRGTLLTVTGRDPADTVIVTLKPGDPDTLRVSLNEQTREFFLAAVGRIRIDGRGGDDLIEIDQSNGPITLPTTLLGGGGNDVLIGGGGGDVVEGQGGDDVLRGQAGDDALRGGRGRDDLAGGVGGDSVAGGRGADSFRAEDDAAGEVLDPGVGEDSVVIPFDQAPRDVRDAVNALLEGAPLDAFKKEYNGTDVLFDAEFRVNGLDQSALLRADGSVVERVSEVDPLSLPVTLTDALERRYPRGRVRTAEFVTLDGVHHYEVDLQVNGQRREVVLTPDGTVQADAVEQPRPAARSRAFSPTVANPYFSLVPGTTLRLEGRDGTEDVVLIITVLDALKMIDGVETRVVEEREFIGGELFEVSKNYFAVDARSKDLYYFGEEVDFYEGGRIVDHRGSWVSGVDGAKFGVLIPGRPAVGMFSQQERAPGVAFDLGEVVSLTETVETPAGTFAGVLRVRETTPLEPSALDFKSWAPGVGLVQSNELKLVSFTRP